VTVDASACSLEEGLIRQQCGCFCAVAGATLCVLMLMTAADARRWWATCQCLPAGGWLGSSVGASEQQPMLRGCVCVSVTVAVAPPGVWQASLLVGVAQSQQFCGYACMLQPAKTTC
jgi:hypothetical protein